MFVYTVAYGRGGRVTKTDRSSNITIRMLALYNFYSVPGTVSGILWAKGDGYFLAELAVRKVYQMNH